MTDQCPICCHPERAALEKAARTEYVPFQLADIFDSLKVSIDHHMAHCLLPDEFRILAVEYQALRFPAAPEREPCFICVMSPDRDKIDAALRGGTALGVVAEIHKVPHEIIARHRNVCLTRKNSGALSPDRPDSWAMDICAGMAAILGDDKEGAQQ